MASSSANGSPWAELEAVYALVQRHPDIDAAISNVMDSYSGAALHRLYDLTLRWGPTFVKRFDGDEKAKRSKLTRYILRRGTADRRAS